MDARRSPSALATGTRCCGRAVFAALFLLLDASFVSAGSVEVTLSGTISSVFGDLDGPVGSGSVVTGTVLLDDTVVGVFTDNGNPTFLRNEMLYPGAVLSTDLSIDGQPVSGSGGDLLLRDAADALAGEDNYEIQAVLDSGTLGGATPVSITLTGEYEFSSFTLTGTEPLSGPPPFDVGRFNPFTLESAAGGSAFGQLDDLDGSLPTQTVPALSPLAGGVLALGMMIGGVVAARRRSA